MQTLRFTFLTSLIALCGFVWPFYLSHPNTQPFGSDAWLNQQIRIIKSEDSSINDNVLRLSLEAYEKVRAQGMDNKQLLTIVDYSLPSTQKRLWVFDLKNGRELFNTWVSHGKNSGGLNATSFSNSNGSLKSSLGVFVTAQPYVGKDGESLRVRGLEQGINNNAYSRNIVFHGAPYVNAGIIGKYGEIGRSWGCFAVSQNLIKPLIDTIKDDTLVFAYYPDHSWLSHSTFFSA